MTGADKAIRWSTIAMVVVVAGGGRQLQLPARPRCHRALQQAQPPERGLPADGGRLIYCGSMVLLNDARRGLDAHRLAYWMLGIGIAQRLTG